MKSRSTKNPLADKPSVGFVYFLNSGVDYYVAGRYALLAKLMPTFGNLLHHAVEMVLKGVLGQKGKSLNELERLGHKLPKIWNEFKTNFPEQSLDAFDPLIFELNKFEEIRYPDLIAEKGGSFLADPGMRPPEVLRELRPEVTRYQLYLGEIDELMGKLFLVARLNSGFFFNRLDPVAKKYLHERNEAFPAE